MGIVKSGRQRRLHKAFLRYHDAQNWPMLREALQKMGRSDLIGNGKRHLVPNFQPAGTGLRRHSGDWVHSAIGRKTAHPTTHTRAKPN